MYIKLERALKNRNILKSKKIKVLMLRNTTGDRTIIAKLIYIQTICKANVT